MRKGIAKTDVLTNDRKAPGMFQNMFNNPMVQQMMQQMSQNPALLRQVCFTLQPKRNRLIDSLTD